jgi:hypothetical protein
MSLTVATDAAPAGHGLGCPGYAGNHTLRVLRAVPRPEGCCSIVGAVPEPVFQGKSETSLCYFLLSLFPFFRLFRFPYVCFQDYLFSLVHSTPASQWHTCSNFPPQICTEVSHNDDSYDDPSDEQLWGRWIEAESKRRLLASCFVLDVHASVYHEQPLTEQFSNPTPPIPLTKGSQDLWEAPTWERWKAIMANSVDTETPVLSEGLVTTERMALAPALDRAVFLASEILRLPRRSPPSALDMTLGVDLSVASRISTLCPESAVANTYLALHFTPLQDLLAVSGDSWVFTHKVLSNGEFQQQQKRLKAWSKSLHAAAAAKFAAKALLGFLDESCLINADAKSMIAQEQFSFRWKTSDITDYWAVHVCALIIWALGHQANRGAGTGGAAAGASVSASNAGNIHLEGEAQGVSVSEEAEAISWLRMVADLRIEDILQSQTRGGPEIRTVVACARRKLDAEAAGGKSRLLIDCLGVMKKLEKGVNWKWF